MRHRVTLVGFWLGGTAFAMLLAALAVQMAGAKVTDARSATVSRRQVESELAHLDASTTLPPASVPGDPRATVPPEGGEGAPTIPSTGPAPTDRPSEGTPSTSDRKGGPPPPPGATTTTAAPTDHSLPPTTRPSTTIDTHGGGPTGPPPTTAPATTTSTKPPMSYETYYLVGGMVRVYCIGNEIRVGTSSPAAGYEMQVPAPGPGSNVDVRFNSPTHHSEFKAHCNNGVILPEQIESNSTTATH